MKILIAGAGIGGVCAALCLQKTGHQVTILEKSASLSVVGAGLQLGANAVKVLDYFDLSAQLEALAVKPDRVEFRAFDSGNVLHSADLGSDYFAKHGAPYLHVHRADLNALLIDALNTETELVFNAPVESFEENAEGVTVTLEDGRLFTGDCLIGADGIRSKIRQQIIGDSAAQFTGNVAWRGTVPASRLPTNFMQKIVSNFVGPSKHMVIYYLRQQQLVNFVGVVEAPLCGTEGGDDLSSSWSSHSPWQDLKKDFDGWHPMVQGVIDAMDKEQCYRWALYDHQAITGWSSQRATLLGDAAHSTLPFLASGAAMAIEDARILQRALDENQSVSAALQCYQANRLTRTAKIQSMSRQVGKLYHIHNPVLLRLAFKAVKWKSVKTEAFLGDYDANTVSLS